MNKEVENNKKQRMKAVERWANFVKDKDDLVWSELQSELIDSQIENAKDIKLTKEQVRYIKGK
ncbi:hypothetical protein J4440_05295 [Candidatus Woesearchaeota archaeon]|nr:hypothetical protein [Candidatus Woesearchaeota archaeon]